MTYEEELEIAIRVCQENVRECQAINEKLQAQVARIDDLDAATAVLVKLEQACEEGRQKLRAMAFEHPVGTTLYADKRDGYVSTYQICEVHGKEERGWFQGLEMAGDLLVTPEGERVHAAWYEDKQLAFQLAPAREVVRAALDEIRQAARKRAVR